MKRNGTWIWNTITGGISYFAGATETVEVSLTVYKDFPHPKSESNFRRDKVQMPIIKCLVGSPKPDTSEHQTEEPFIKTEQNGETIWKRPTPGRWTIEDRYCEMDAFMDSGAAFSFIDAKIAKQLQLPIMGYRTLKMSTFPNDLKERKCTIVLATFPDIGIRPLFSIEGLLSEQLVQQMTPEEITELKNQNLRLQRDPRMIHFVKTELLIGQDLITEFTDIKTKPHKLSTGLMIHHSIYGSYYAGQRTPEHPFWSRQC